MRLRNDVSLTDAIILTLILWIGSMGLLALDAFSIDIAVYVSVVVAIFGFILGMTSRLATLEERMGENIKTVADLNARMCSHFEKEEQHWQRRKR